MSRHSKRTPAATTAIREVWICCSPKAGSGAGRDQITRTREALTRSGIQAEWTTDISELRRALADAENDKAVVAAGGDGTAALVAETVPPHVPIVPLPLGTENLLARYFGYSSLAEDTAATIVGNQRFQIDAGKVGDRLFLVMLTAGFDAEVVRAMHLTRRGHIRRWSYAFPIWRAIRRYKFPSLNVRTSQDADGPVRPQSNESAHQACWAMVFNLPCYATSLAIEPAAVPDDGWLDCITFEKGRVLQGLGYLVRIALKRHLHHPHIRRQKVRRLWLTSPIRTPYQIDGDYGGRLPVEITWLPNRVTLLQSCRADGQPVKAPGIRPRDIAESVIGKSGANRNTATHERLD